MLIVHHLQNSRSQRILWLLEELGLDYQIKSYARDPETSFAPPELTAIHPLGKSPVLEDEGQILIESGAITDYVLRRHGGGRLLPAPVTAAHEAYHMWLHYAEGSAMLPFLLGLYTGKLGPAGAPLMPRIQSETLNHLGYFSQQLGDQDWLIDNTLSGADIMMSFIAELAAVRGLGAQFPNLVAYARRIQSRPAWLAAAARTEPYAYRLPG